MSLSAPYDKSEPLQTTMISLICSIRSSTSTTSGRTTQASIVEILSGDWLFKVDELNTRSYVLEFGVNSEGAQQSPMVIEG